MSIKITIPNTSSDTLTFGSANTPTAAQIAGIDSGSSNGQLALYTTASGTSTERMRIDSSGNLLVGTTSASSRRAYFKGGTVNVQNYTFDYDNASGNAYVMQLLMSALSPNNSTSRFLTCADSTTDRLRLLSNGGVENYSANNVNLSDRREKTNFAPAKSYLAVICSIPVQTYNYIDQNLEEDAGLTLGVVAQDVQTVAPELVKESNWGTEEEPKMRLSIYQTDLQYALMKCIQEQQALITQLQVDVAALKGASA
jgi:hypothetical protein